jgi:pimeloyl-ACP methyl ester carboxylesterase
MSILKKHSFFILLILYSTINYAQVSKPLYVIVHGAWGGSWAFKKTDSLLTAKGCKVYRPCLTGLGERAHLATPLVSLKTHITDVVNTILYEDLHNVILVGHSYGGMVISGVADKIPERIQKVIYLDAFVPSDSESVKTIQAAKWDQYEKMVRGDFLAPPWMIPGKIPGDVPQPLKTFTESVSLKNEKAKLIPGVYILTVEKGKKPEEDDFAGQAERAKQKKWTIVQLETDHNPQWSATPKLVDLLYQNR